MTGRFLDLAAGHDPLSMAELYRRLPVAVETAVPVQLSFPPRHPHLENVTRVPLVLSEGVISLAEHRDESVARIPLEDLAVTADNDRLYLVSMSRRQLVEPVITNAAALTAIPPLARLLFEIPRVSMATVSPFAWGVAKCLPFLPRVRYGRSVLAPARWRVPTGDLPGPGAPWATWTEAVARLRERLCLPTNVHVGTADRRLRLNLDDPMDLALLRAHVKAADKVVMLSEAPSTSDHRWFGGRAHEILIPLATTVRPARAPAVVSAPGPLPIIKGDQASMPGSRVLFAKLYSHPDVHNSILIGHLPRLLSMWENPPLWWFVRYRDPQPHLRLRLRLDSPHEYGQAAVHVGAWAEDLRQRGLIGDLTLDTYHPETARYGSGVAQDSAEAVFAADSTAVTEQLKALSASRTLHPVALTAASLVDLASAMTGSLPAGMRWFIDRFATDATSALDRPVLRQAVHLTELLNEDQSLLSLPNGPRLAAAWQARRAAATAYASHLTADGAHVNPSSALGSLLHMHHVRALGINSDSERLCRRLARSAALAWAARHTPSQGGRR